MMAAFQLMDYVVFIATIGVSFSIGVIFGVRDRKNSSPSNYFTAEGHFNFIPVALSFVVTFQSSLLMLGIPVDVYLYGMATCFECVGAMLSSTFAVFVVVPIFHSLEITSVYKYFELRYGSNEVRYLAVASGVLFNIMYTSMVTYGTCVALDVVIGIPYWGTILLYTTITTIYTSIGGIKAVIWTDVLQLIIMLIGITAVLVKSTNGAGGSGNVFKLAADRLDLKNFQLDPRVRFQTWNMFGSFSAYLFLALSQSSIQRIKSTPTIFSARLLLITSVPVYSLLFVMVASEGATIFAYYDNKGCDIYASGVLNNVNEIIPLTILELFQDTPGLPGLFIASLSSAALSTLSSCLSSLSAITYDDVIKVKYPNLSNVKATRLSKLVVLLYGFVAMAIAMLMSRISGTVTMLYHIFVGGLSGPVSAIFVLSMLFSRSTTKGMLIGGLCGIVVCEWLAIGKMFSHIPPDPTLPAGSLETCPSIADDNSTPYSIWSNISTVIPSSTTQEAGSQDELSPLEQIYSVSFMLFSFIGFAITILLGALISLCTTPPDHVDPRCIYSFKKSDTCKPDTYENDMEECKHEESKLMDETTLA